MRAFQRALAANKAVQTAEVRALHVKAVRRTDAELELVFGTANLNDRAICRIAKKPLPIRESTDRETIVDVVPDSRIYACRMYAAIGMKAGKSCGGSFRRVDREERRFILR